MKIPRNLLEVNLNLINKYFDDRDITFEGPTTMFSKKYGLTSAAELELDFRVYMYDAKLVQKDFPASYWKDVFLNRIKQAKQDAAAKLAEQIKYDPTLAEQGKKELENFLLHLTGNKDELAVTVLQQFIWMVKRKLNGLSTSYHIMPILFGGQGTGKSTAINILTAPLIKYTIKGKSVDFVTDERQFKTLSEHFIVVFDEMAKANKVDVNHLKNIITTDSLTGRQLYTNLSSNMQQSCTFIGSTNKAVKEIIVDDTGMRRFFQIDVLKQANFDELNKTDVMTIWKSIDETSDVAYTANKATLDALAVKQEDLRTPGTVEEFLNGCSYTQAPAGSGAARVSLQTLFDEYMQFCERSNIHFAVTKQSFSKQLQDRGWVRADEPKGKRGIEFYTNPVNYANSKPMSVIGDFLTKKGLDS